MSFDGTDGTATVEVRTWIEEYSFERFEQVHESFGSAEGRWGASGLLLNGRWTDLDFATHLENDALSRDLDAPPANVLLGPAGPYACDVASFTYTDLGEGVIPGFAPVTWIRQSN